MLFSTQRLSVAANDWLLHAMMKGNTAECNSPDNPVMHIYAGIKCAHCLINISGRVTHSYSCAYAFTPIFECHEVESGRWGYLVAEIGALPLSSAAIIVIVITMINISTILLLQLHYSVLPSLSTLCLAAAVGNEMLSLLRSVFARSALACQQHLFETRLLLNTERYCYLLRLSFTRCCNFALILLVLLLWHALITLPAAVVSFWKSRFFFLWFYSSYNAYKYISAVFLSCL